MVHSKDEIIKGIENIFNEIIEWIENQPDNDFEKNINKKWSTAQQLDHLIKCLVPINQAFWLPKLCFLFLFGKPNREGRNFEKLKEKYKKKLNEGGKAKSKFIPSTINSNQKKKLLNQFNKEKTSLLKHLKGWKEGQLDNFLLPHPLLGKLTIREMMFFTIFHSEHHLNSLKALYQN